MSAQPELCSDARQEPLPGTAKPGQLFVALEHPTGWGHDILDGHCFGDELTAQLKAYTKQHNVQLQLIRKPGREGQEITRRTVFIADVHGRIRTTSVCRPEELLDIDPRSEVGQVVDKPVLLVCTHGKRDQCCAIKGRPLAAYLAAQFSDGTVWESSHTKGHRFAPSIIVLPWGYSFGRLNESAAADLVRHFQRGELFLPGNRGRACWNPRGQVAELAVAAQLPGVRAGQLLIDAPAEGPVTVRSGERVWRVDLEQRAVEGVISSCGDAPKTGKAWVAVGVTPVE
ncbi:sucrase ferredoxin [Staphylococcus chromogenes]|nr:sucrase ferredoxin [Staphylococcus chromogenes]